ncbi:UDP-glucose--hexose-1-phosphate uridylyltransferase [Alteribacter lacisalsi]|uniref:Galactose-1-phosphate uridylyltransferase n=1 Tax=Alteribacter lacisalsi TaxID=2045244 RepID=A0A2W0H9C5_9BACI|nr:UDP-glucose--hexose-1-phosphate uridylyltransferase [Alteribacter lacisalsi]PYZ97531.1 UDP-glucose--hexose-1-phosphate uridylyltransferase [Alteribacter lacisalsi]
MNIYTEIERLLQYGRQKDLFEEVDQDYVRNGVFSVLGLNDAESAAAPVEALQSPVPILSNILDWAYENGRLEENTVTRRDLLDTKIMGCLAGRPSDILYRFDVCEEENGIEAATSEFYAFSKDVHYIRTDRIAKNESWFTETEYGSLEITINLSKPEKDPREIAAAKKVKQASYPKCLLCRENVGFEGRINHPARQNLRTIPINLGDERWHLQFSPYVYYNEHAIVFKDAHEPMKIHAKTFKRLLAFTERFPHYFIGSNADLPIVGGSILSHDHFQGGSHTFPMAEAEVETGISLDRFPGVQAGIVKWPMSVLRISGKDAGELTEAADDILHQWKAYSDESVGIHAFTGDTPHNTITPIARKRDGLFELDLVLRNNRTDEEHPEGIFHPHREVHHIKKENIGLIEVMGLAVLPGRLKTELAELAEAMTSQDPQTEIRSSEVIRKHEAWAMVILEKYPEIDRESAPSVLKEEVGRVFAEILSHAGVFKRDEAGRRAFRAFTDTL